MGKWDFQKRSSITLPSKIALHYIFSMARHSHFHNIMLKKGAADRKRAKTFTRHARLIAVAAQKGGGDPEGNAILRMAMDNARLDNVPKDNIDRAIQKGTGDNKDGIQISEAVYEAFGPGKVALMISVMTDNKNRALNSIRKLVQDAGGRIAESGSISWQFEHKGQIEVASLGSHDEDELKLIDAGAEDIEEIPGGFLVFTKLQKLDEVRVGLQAAGFTVKSAAWEFIPKNFVKVEDAAVARAVLELIEALDENEDIDKVSANFDIPEGLV